MNGGMRTKRRGALLTAAWGVTTTLALSAVVSWTLARPGADPVGDAVIKLWKWPQTLAEQLHETGARDEAAWDEVAMRVQGGDPQAGARLIAGYGCGACHRIPGVANARGSVGPDLSGLRDQAYIAGVLPNRPGQLVNWLQSPPRYSADTAMPDMGVTEADAEAMAAYLYTLDRH